MTTTPLSTPPVRIPIGQDNWFAREKIADGIGNLNSAVTALQTLVGENQSNTNAINGNLSFGNISQGQAEGNLKTQMFMGTSPSSANTAFTLTHKLGKIPNGAILIQSNATATLYGNMTDQAWTSTTITLLLNQASISYVILVLG